MAKTPTQRDEELAERDARIAQQAAAQRGPVAPEFSEPVGATPEEQPPHAPAAPRRRNRQSLGILAICALVLLAILWWLF